MDDLTLLEEIKEIHKIISEKYEYITETSETISGGSCLYKRYINPHETFDFLEFVFQSDYVDVFKNRGVIFIDDKVTWEFLIKTDNGFFRIYDWKGGSVSIGSVGSRAISDELKADIEYFLVEVLEHQSKLAEYKKIVFQEALDNTPLYNFNLSWIAITILLNQSYEQNKKKTGYIESLMLLVSSIDTYLRYILLLHRVAVAEVSEPTEDMHPLFYQQEGKKFFTERKIMNLVKQEVPMYVVDKDKLFKNLHRLYDERNRVVHRFSISSVQYTEIPSLLYELDGIQKTLFSVVRTLEWEQVNSDYGWLTQEHLEVRPDKEMEDYMDTAFRMKVDPTYIAKAKPERDAMFSDKYEDGIHPKLKPIIEKIEEQFESRHGSDDEDKE